jgi:hypothetical protein
LSECWWLHEFLRVHYRTLIWAIHFALDLTTWLTLATLK